MFMKNNLNVGEDKNLNVCCWDILVKTSLNVGQIINIQFHTYSLTKYFTNIHIINITALAELLVGVFRQHTGFSLTSFTNIRTVRSPILANLRGTSWTDFWKTNPNIILYGQDDRWPSVSNPWGDCKSLDQWFDGDLEKCYEIFWKSSLLDLACG